MYLISFDFYWPSKRGSYFCRTLYNCVRLKDCESAVLPSVRLCTYDTQTDTRIFMTSDFVEFYDNLYSHVNFASKSNKHNGHFKWTRTCISVRISSIHRTTHHPTRVTKARWLRLRCSPVPLRSTKTRRHSFTCHYHFTHLNFPRILSSPSRRGGKMSIPHHSTWDLW